MFSFYGKSEPQTPNQEDRSSRASTPTSSKKKKKSSKGKPSFQMVELNEGGAPGSPDIESHHLHRTSTDIVNAAEGAEGMDLDGDISVVQSTGDGKQIKFKKAKKLRRAASKHYLKHLNDAKASRFRDWKRDQLIHAIVFTKKLELRGEKTIETEALRDLCESLFPPDEDMPAKHKGYDFGALVKRIVAARRIQNTWIIYQAVKREIQEENMADSYNSRIDDYDESNIQDLGRTELMMMMEGAQDDGRPSQSDVEAGGASKVPDDEANAGPSLAVAKARGKRNILDLPWTPPDYAKAVAYANYIQPRKGGKGGSKFDYLRTTTGRHCCLTGWGEQFDLWNEGQISEFSPYGPGITNYFKFLKWAFWVFVLLTVAALPCLVINMTGSTTDQGLSAIAQTTIGSLSNNAGGSLYYDNSTQAYVYNTTTNVYKTVNVRLPGCSNYGLVDTDCYLNGNSLALFYAIIDIIVSVIIFVGYVWLSVFEKLEESKLDENTVLASHYTVKVSRFPPETTEDQLKEHFTKLVGKRGAAAVADVSFAYNNSREILLCKARGDLIRRKVLLVHEHRFKCTAIRSRTDWTEEKKNDVIQRERDRLKETMNRYNDDLKRKDKELEEISKESPKPIAAFVTFNYVTDQRLALEKYTHRSFISMLCGHPELNLGGVTLKVRQAAEPSVIVWENMEFTESNRFGRNIATFLVSLLLVAISLAMIFSSKYLEQRSSNNGSSSSELCPSNFYAFTPAEQLAITEDFPNLLYCYCGELSLSSTEKVCQEYFTRQAQAQVLTYFASFIVIIVNNLIVRMVRYSAQFEKHHSSDGQSMSIFFRLFALKYINTAAVFLINGNNVILQKVFGLQDDTSSSVEFGTTWYSTVAVTIVLVQLGDAFNAQLGNLKDYFFLERRKRLSRENPKYALTQDELNRSHVGPQFEFAFTYAQIMSTFFVCLTFSTGIPILYPIAAFNFLLFYFMEKYMFIHLYKIPPHFTTMVGRRATALIPFAILMHLAMSIWMLSNNELFVADQKTESDATLVSSFKFGSTIREKITGQATFPLFMTFCAIIIVHVLYFYYKYFRKTVDGLYDFLFGFVTLRKQEARIKREQKENWKAKVPFARAVLRNLIKGLSSYNILRNPEYKEAFGITWKFAVENKGVRAVRQMKAKAQAAVEEEDAEKAEELQRSTLASHSGGVGTSSATKPSKKVRNALKAVDSARNRSFYGALSAADDGAPRSGRETSGAGGSGRDGSGRDGSGRGGSSGQQGGSGRSSGQQGGSGRSSGQQGGSGRSSHDQTPVSGSGSGRRNEQRPVSAAVTRAAAAPSTPQGTFMYAPQTASAHQQRPVSLPMSPVAVAGGAYHAVPPSPDPYMQQQRQQAQQQYRGGYQQVPQPPTR